MKRFGLALVVLIITVVFIGAGDAAYGESVRIAVIDVQKVMQEAKAARDAKGMFLMDVESRRGELKKREEQVRELEKEFREKEADMSASDKKKKKEEILKAVQDLRDFKKGVEDELKKQRREVRRKLIKDIEEIVQRFTKKKGYTIVLDKRSVIASGEAVDISDEIIQIYDTQKR